MPFLHVTTRIEGAAHDGLLKDKGGRGFPTLMFLDAEGNILAQQGDRSVAGFEATLASLQRWRDLKQRADKGDKGVEVDLLLVELQLGKVKFADGKARAARIPMLTGEQKAQLDQLLLDAEVGELLEADDEGAAKTRLAEIAASGRQPSKEHRTGFWYALSQHAEAQKDLALFEKAYEGLKAELADEPRAAKFLEDLGKKLEEMKKGAAG